MCGRKNTIILVMLSCQTKQINFYSCCKKIRFRCNKKKPYSISVIGSPAFILAAIGLKNVGYGVWLRKFSHICAPIEHNLMCLLFQFLFWGAVFALFHSYVLYPWLLRYWARGRQLNDLTFSRHDENLPYIIVMMAAYNEGKIIEQKLKSVFDTDYPDDQFEVIIGSDGSTDNTDSIVQQYTEQHDNLLLTRFEGRNGKSNILNQLMERYGTAICSFGCDCLLVLTDANVLFTRATLYELAKHFKNPDIGVVGSFVYNPNAQNRGIALQENAYISRENDIKYLEGLVSGTMMGAFGACYALRANLFVPIPPNFLMEDFYLTMCALEKGKKAIAEPKAICHEAIPDEVSVEFKRKKRISAGNFQNLRRFAALLLPARNGVWFAFWSHKVLRWLGPFFILTALASSAYLAQTSIFYRVLLAVQLALLLLPALDWLLRQCHLHNRWLRLGSYFYLMNWALLAGFWQYLRGVKTNAWSPPQR